MNIIEINVAGICDKFYDIFFEKLNENENFNIYEYIPCSVNEFEKHRKKNYDVIYAPIKNNFDRFLLKKKSKKYENFLINNFDINSVKLIHAHSLFSDGMVALRLNKKYNIPYIVAFRATDEEIFLKYFLLAKAYMDEIVKNAKKIIFINPSCYERIVQKYPHIFDLEKVEIIPNGIDNYWEKNKSKHELNSEITNILQVSRFVNEKNIDKSIYAINKLIKEGHKVHFNIIGQGKNEKKLIKLVEKLNLNDHITFHKYVYTKEEMRNMYRKNDIFLLPSKNETFGISYIEALSQGLPIIGMNDGGVSGYLKQNESCLFLDDSNSDGIANAILSIIKEYERRSLYCHKDLNLFNWESIIKKYVQIYIDIIEGDEEQYEN